MKVLVTGVKGQLGYDVCKVLNERGIENLGVDAADFDITDADAVSAFMRHYAPDIIVHCAAYTAVDKAEDNAELCYKVNADGTRNIATVCKAIGAKMAYISTDYVFSGTGDKPYGVDDPTGPESVYGKTKLAGELAVKEILDKFFIVRVSWVFGKNGNNFVKTMLRIGKERDEVNVVCDQIGSPTYTADLASLLCNMIVTERYGIYHATNEGYCSWADFAEEIFMLAGYHTKVKRVTTEEYPAKAQRPHNSRLSKKSLTDGQFSQLPAWQTALRHYCEEIKEGQEL